MKRVYVFRDGRMVPKEEAMASVGERGPLIMGDLPDFVSPIDQTVINGRAGYREHCRRHNVTNISDYKEQWDRQAKERARYFTEGPSKGVKEALIRAFNEGRPRRG